MNDLVSFLNTLWYPYEKKINQMHILREHYIRIKSKIQNNKKGCTEVSPYVQGDVKGIKQEILERHSAIRAKILDERYLGDGYDIKPIENELLDDINNLLEAIHKDELKLRILSYFIRAVIIILIFILIFLVVLFKTIF